VPVSEEAAPLSVTKPPGSFLTHLAQDLPNYGLAQIVLFLSGLLVVPVIAHLFPPNAYGDYVICSSLIDLVVLIIVGWLPSAILRFYPVYEKSGAAGCFVKWSAGATLYTTLAVAGLGALLLWRMSPFLRQELRLMLWLTLPLVVLHGTFSVISTFLRTMRRVATYAWAQILYKSIQMAVGIVWVFLVRRQISSFFGAWIVSGVVVNVWIWSNLRSRAHMKPEARVGSIISGKELFVYGYPLVFTLVFAQLLLVGDRYVLDILKNSYAVGLYSLGFLVGQIPQSMVFAPLMSACYPLLMHSWEHEPAERTGQNLRLIVRYYVLLAMPACAGIWALARPIIAVFGSEAYAQASETVPWIAAAFFLSGLAQFVLITAHLTKKTALHAIAVASSFVLNLSLNFLLIPHFSYRGSAIALFGSMVFYNLIAWRFCARLVPLSLPWGSFARITGGALVMGVILAFYLRWVGTRATTLSFAFIPVAVAIYFAALIMFGEFSRQEARALESLIPWRRR